MSDLPIIDGVDLWPSLSNDQESPRNSMLHNIDESRNISALRVGDWKMVKGSKYWPMPENSSLLFSSCHLELAIFWKIVDFLHVIFRIVDSRQSEPLYQFFKKC